MFIRLLATFRHLQQLSVTVECDRHKHLLPWAPTFEMIVGDGIGERHTCFIWLGRVFIELGLPHAGGPAAKSWITAPVSIAP